VIGWGVCMLIALALVLPFTPQVLDIAYRLDLALSHWWGRRRRRRAIARAMPRATVVQRR
jgi:hypothetical protein